MDLKEQLWDSFKDRTPVKVTSHYQGLPMSCLASVVMLSHDLLALKIDARMMSLARLERRVYLECSSCTEILKAVPIAYEHRDSVGVFDRIVNVSPAAMRKLNEIHIRPREKVLVHLDGEQDSDGYLIDFQTEENGDLIVRGKFGQFPALERSQPLSITLDSPTELGMTRLDGKLVRLNRQTRPSGTRVLISIDGAGAPGGTLHAYLAVRRQEIEAEWART